MDQPFPMRSLRGEGVALRSFDRHSRIVRKSHKVHKNCQFRRPQPPPLPKRKSSPETNSPPPVMIKRQRRIQNVGFSAPSYNTDSCSSDSDNDTAFSYVCGYCESPTSWLNEGGQAEYHPTLSILAADTVPAFLEDLKFHDAAQQHFAGLDVERLISSPGPELVCHDHISRGRALIYHNLEPHSPRRNCMCHSCGTDGVYIAEVHDPSHRCYCIACDAFFGAGPGTPEFLELLRENERRVLAFELQLEEDDADDEDDFFDCEEPLDEGAEEAKAAQELRALQLERLRFWQSRQ